MKLNEVIQSKTELRVEKLDRPLVFNNITLADQAWLMENYTTEEIVSVFLEVKTEDILKIAVRFLDDKSKEFLSKLEMVERDEFGEKLEPKRFTLAQKLFSVCSEFEFVELVKKIFELRNKSMEQIKKAQALFEKKTEDVQVEPVQAIAVPKE